MDGGKCILQIRGERPFLSDKFDIKRHKNYRYLSDANQKNVFNIEKYVSTKLKVKPDEEYEYFEFTPPETDTEMPIEAIDDFTEYPEDLEPL
jgi:type IV secretion system protein VirD4